VSGPRPFNRILPPSPVAVQGPHAELLSRTMLELAALIRDREISSRELTSACLERIEALDGAETLNAFILSRGEDVLTEAGRADAALAGGARKGPLHGVPLGIKDALHTAGTTTTGGTAVFRDWTPENDATAVTLLKKAGAIVLGKTNLHESGFGITSHNPHFRPVRNPYDPNRIPGGSSGGSGAAVGAGLCPAALGTDTGGSVRIPPALCGGVGLKPTLGRASRGGMFGLSWSYDVLGPITRSVADAALLMDLLTSGPDARDPGAVTVPDGFGIPVPTGDPDTLRGLRVGVPGGYFSANTPEVDRVLTEAQELLEQAGASLVPVTVAHADIATPIGFLTVIPEAVVLAEEAFALAGVEGGVAAHLDMFGDDVKHALGSQVGRDAQPTPAWEYARALRETVPTIRRGFLDALDGIDVLLTATTPSTAVPLTEHVEMMHNGKPADTFETFVRYTFCVSVAGLPALSIPGGVDNQGLPVGLQLIGPAWSEGRLTDIGYAFEKLTTD
jgi:aspartyl-tRNA(Asn)/glutamyl-tRNA(Gln) amidotransferase subunit A